jgi:hypothetical protein
MPIPFEEYQADPKSPKPLKPPKPSAAEEARENDLLAKLDQKPYQAYTFAELLPKTTLALRVAEAALLDMCLQQNIKKGLIKSKALLIEGNRVLYYISAKAR